MSTPVNVTTRYSDDELKEFKDIIDNNIKYQDGVHFDVPVINITFSILICSKRRSLKVQKIGKGVKIFALKHFSRQFFNLKFCVW